jgi:hypothetical protein
LLAVVVCVAVLNTMERMTPAAGVMHCDSFHRMVFEVYRCVR